MGRGKTGQPAKQPVRGEADEDHSARRRSLPVAGRTGDESRKSEQNVMMVGGQGGEENGEDQEREERVRRTL